jgi:hypothetical protein
MSVKAHLRNPGLSFFWVAALCVIATGRVAASSGTFQAFGYVYDEQGNPITGISVIGDDYVGDFYVFKSDATGRYSVDFPSDGNYKLYVSCPESMQRGYACVTPYAITIADGAINIDFYLAPLPLQVTNASLPKATIGASYHVQLGAVGGQPPYNWELAPDSAAMPDGLQLNSAGLIFGVPTTNAGASLKLQLTDVNSATTNKTLALVVNPRPVLTALGWTTNRFSMLLTGASNQNYTVQGSTNLSNWTSVLITNNKTANAFLVADPKATNGQKLYRVLVGP